MPDWHYNLGSSLKLTKSIMVSFDVFVLLDYILRIEILPNDV